MVSHMTAYPNGVCQSLLEEESGLYRPQTPV